MLFPQVTHSIELSGYLDIRSPSILSHSECSSPCASSSMSRLLFSFICVLAKREGRGDPPIESPRPAAERFVQPQRSNLLPVFGLRASLPPYAETEASNFRFVSLKVPSKSRFNQSLHFLRNSVRDELGAFVLSPM